MLVKGLLPMLALALLGLAAFLAGDRGRDGRLSFRRGPAW
jgi:hypothetical protein